jgi:hypothetical protein
MMVSKAMMMAGWKGMGGEEAAANARANLGGGGGDGVSDMGLMLGVGGWGLGVGGWGLGVGGCT